MAMRWQVTPVLQAKQEHIDALLAATKTYRKADKEGAYEAQLDAGEAALAASPKSPNVAWMPEPEGTALSPSSRPAPADRIARHFERFDR